MQQQLDAMQEQVDAMQQQIAQFLTPGTISQEIAGSIQKRLVTKSNKPVSDITQTLTKDPIGVLVPSLPDGFDKLANGKNYPFYLDK